MWEKRRESRQSRSAPDADEQVGASSRGRTIADTLTGLPTLGAVGTTPRVGPAEVVAVRATEATDAAAIVFVKAGSGLLNVTSCKKGERERARQLGLQPVEPRWRCMLTAWLQ